MTLRPFLALLLLAAVPSLAPAQCVEELIGSEALSSDEFGAVIAMDGARAAIGTPRGEGPVHASGAVYVFERRGATWLEVQRVFPPQVGYVDFFGEAVDLDGDVLIGGAPLYDAHVQDDGAAFVFELVGGTWTYVAELLPTQTGGAAEFGRAVAVEGARAVIGAPSGAGGAWVFERTGSGWVELQRLPPPAGVDDFGMAVALSGDRIVVGTDQSRVYVYELVGSSWIESAILQPSAPPTMHFGNSVALQGERLLIGTPAEGTPGAAYLLEHRAGSWNQVAKLESRSGFHPQEEFGFSVALDGSRALVGAPFRQLDGQLAAGAAYLFHERNGVWRHSYELFDPTPTGKSSMFGRTVALQGAALLVGVPGDDFHGNGSGSAVALTLPDSAVTTCFCSGTPPCGNLEPMTGCRNSTNVGALLSPCGTDSIARDDLVLTTTGLPPNQWALLFAGTTDIAIPFGDGRLCAGGTQRRLQLENAGSAGQTVYGPGLAAQAGFDAGELRHFQVWYRDPQGPCGSGFNTSSGILLHYAP